MDSQHVYCPFAFEYKGVEVRCEYRAEGGAWFCFFDLPEKSGASFQQVLRKSIPLASGRHHVERRSAAEAKDAAVGEIEGYFDE